MDGWICLHRKMVDWEWYDDVNTFKLFMHLLLSATYKSDDYKGEKLKPGDVFTGRKRLSIDSGLSEQQIRTALKKLEKTNEITIKSTKKYSIISIVKWEEYQSINQQPNQEATKKQPRSNHTQQVNNITKEENIYNTREDHFVQLSTIDLSWVPNLDAQEYCRSLGLEFDGEYKKFINHYAGTGQKNHNWNFKFKAWCDIAIEKKKNEKNNEHDKSYMKGVSW